jgi:hypothetical protein
LMVSRRRRAGQCDRAPLWRWVSRWRRGHRRICAAHAPSSRPLQSDRR